MPLWRLTMSGFLLCSAVLFANRTADASYFKSTLFTVQNGELRPGLVTAWRKIGPNRFVWTLDKNAKFPNKVPFTAASLKTFLEEVYEFPLQVSVTPRGENEAEISFVGDEEWFLY